MLQEACANISMTANVGQDVHVDKVHQDRKKMNWFTRHKAQSKTGLEFMELSNMSNYTMWMVGSCCQHCMMC